MHSVYHVTQYIHNVYFMLRMYNIDNKYVRCMKIYIIHILYIISIYKCCYVRRALGSASEFPGAFEAARPVRPRWDARIGRKHAGTQARRHIGAQARRHVGTQTHMRAGTQARRHIGTQTRRHVGTQTHMQAGTQARRHASALVPGGLLFSCWDPGVRHQALN